ncbi:E3 ubiquitin-protein ligase MARCH7 [Megalops cyprinoides]|uniref:E3 ubiquitin-protein ligase MARCH7 n=1 Tax=Megalops cyprinoides TaxID=118141 RepID=UPI001863CE3E|nr:E3 ubiquitin-protein ligase MARCH7 [Megalops cyprinoides]
MESKSRRLPFMGSSSASSLSSSSSFSSSSPLGTSRLYGRGTVLSSDRYTRGTSVKLDSEHQGPRFQSSPRDYCIPESRHSSWKLPSPVTPAPVSRDRSWTDTVGSSSKMFNYQGDSERRLGTYSGLLSATQDGDSKRPKLSYANRASYSRSPSSSVLGSTSSSIGSVSDSSWKTYSPLSRSSSSVSSEGLRSRREAENRSESTLSGHRSAGLSSLYCADRVTSSYAQGARPKESLYSSSSSSRGTSSAGHHPSSDYQPLSSRDSCRSTSRISSSTSASLRAAESSLDPEPRGRPSRDCSWYVPLSERSSSTASTPPTRQAGESGEPDGRRSTRQLLSRLASSMSSSLFSRRSSQDSSTGSSSASRSFESSDDSSELRREEGSSASAGSSRNSSPDASERRGGAEPAQGFAFLRRRRQGLAPVLETGGAEPDPDADPGRPGGAWLSSSLRRRCPPLFSRRRREGRDETARRDETAHLADARHGGQLPLARRGSLEVRAADGDREDEEEEDEEEESEGARAAGPAGATASGASVQDAPQAGRGRRLSGVTSNSLFRISVPPTLDNSLPENVMITVDIMAAGRAPERQEEKKQASSRDPEKLRKIQESLLLEESDEEEGDLCRICQMKEESPSNPLVEPCRCTGSLRYVHQDCMKKWLRSKISSGSNLEAVTTCEMCKEKLHLNIENFDINELYRTHERSEYEFISCGLYLVVLLHLCEQRFSDVLGAATDAGFLSLARTLHEHMDDLESSYGESEEEGQVRDSRPSIDFCDLDDDEEEED